MFLTHETGEFSTHTAEVISGWSIQFYIRAVGGAYRMGWVEDGQPVLWQGLRDLTARSVMLVFLELMATRKGCPERVYTDASMAFTCLGSCVMSLGGKHCRFMIGS